jgi:hypothetical protein
MDEPRARLLDKLGRGSSRRAGQSQRPKESNAQVTGHQLTEQRGKAAHRSGRATTGRHVSLLRAGRTPKIIVADGSALRRLDLDPSTDDEPMP